MSSKANTDVYGLILSGGKSSRMGKDKGSLIYHQLPQEEHLYQMLKQLLPKVYLSKKIDQHHLPTIADKYAIESPLNGILSAFDKHPKVTWLVISCDMPLIEPEDVTELLSLRDETKIATCYLSDDDKPHPLFAIYEPSSYPLLQKFALENISPRQFLMQQEQVKCIPLQNDHLKGANTPEEREKILGQIRKI